MKKRYVVVPKFVNDNKENIKYPGHTSLLINNRVLDENCEPIPEEYWSAHSWITDKLLIAEETVKMMGSEYQILEVDWSDEKVTKRFRRY